MQWHEGAEEGIFYSHSLHLFPNKLRGGRMSCITQLSGFNKTERLESGDWLLDGGSHCRIGAAFDLVSDLAEPDLWFHFDPRIITTSIHERIVSIRY